MDGKVYSIVGLPRRAAVDRAYIGLRVSDEMVAKVLAISEVAQIARAEVRSREYLHAKWQARADQATKTAAALAAKGRPADKVEGAVHQIMERWAGDVTDAFTSEMEGVYRLARVAAYRKAALRTPESLQYDTPSFTDVTKGKKVVKVVPKFDLADQGSIAALKEHQVFWIGDHYKKNVSDNVAKTAREVIVEAGGNRAKAGALMSDRLAGTLAAVEVPGAFIGTSKQYFEGLTANAATVARAHGQLRSFADIGASAYTIVNPNDERTCDFCSHMDGKVFKLKQGLDQMHAELKAKNPKQVRAAHPWIGSKALRAISSKAGHAGSKDADALAAAGQAMPPFHFRCRCTVDISADIGSFSKMMPFSAPTEELEAEPLGYMPSDGEEQTPQTEVQDKNIVDMLTGKILKRKKIAKGGVNASEFIDLESTDGTGTVVKGVWKEAAGEEKDLRPNIEAGTYWKREELTYQVDRMLGPDTVVPPTITRKINGKEGSFQAFAEGAKDIDGSWTVLRAVQNQPDEVPSFRRTFLLDVITGNDDRHAGNLLYKAVDGKPVAVAIDNGLTFPEGPAVRFIIGPTPYDHIQDRFLKLDAASQKSLSDLDFEKMAKAIAKAGVKRKGARAALVRAQALKDDPDILDKARQSGNSNWQKVRRNAIGTIQALIRQSAEEPELVVGEKNLAAIDKLLDAAYK